MYANPKETTSLRLDATTTEAFEEYMDELVCRGGPRGEGQHHEDPVRGLHGELPRAGEEASALGRGRKMSGSSKMRKLSVRSFAFQIVLEGGDIPFDPVDAGFEAGGGTAVTSVKIPEDVAGEMESVLKGLGTNFSQAARLLALQTTALGGMPFAAGIPQKAR